MPAKGMSGMVSAAWDSMHGWGWAIVFFSIAFSVATIALLFWAISQWTSRRDNTHEPRRESPREILDRRLARGEIGLDEYQRALESLHGSRTAGRLPRRV